jgi:hypothetical protein
VLTVGVLEGWADPQTDPTEIDWAPRNVGADPVRRGCGSSGDTRTAGGIYGRAGLGRWGENPMCDALVTLTVAGSRHLLLVARGDGRGWAVPGGSIEAGETPAVAASRELAEETGLALPAEAWQAWPPRWVPDPRGTDEAWGGHCPPSPRPGCRRRPARRGRRR